LPPPPVSYAYDGVRISFLSYALSHFIFFIPFFYKNFKKCKYNVLKWWLGML